MVPGVRIPHLDRLGQSGDGLEKELLLPIEHFEPFDSKGNGGGEGIGQIQIGLGERILEESAVEMENANLRSGERRTAQMIDFHPLATLPAAWSSAERWQSLNSNDSRPLNARVAGVL